MIDFARPIFLLLLLIVPLLIWRWLRQRQGGLRYPATGPLATLPVGDVRIARWLGASLRALAFSLLIIALAGPRWVDPGTRLPTEGIAIMTVVDVSGSMATKDFEWQGQRISRLEALKKVFRLFVEGGHGPDGHHLQGRPDDLIGVVVFGTRPDSLCPPTLDHAALLRMLDWFILDRNALEKLEQDGVPDSVLSKLQPVKDHGFYTEKAFLNTLQQHLSEVEVIQHKARLVHRAQMPRPRDPGEGETNISDAIAMGLHRLQQATPRRKVLVLLSDGEHNVLEPKSQWKPRKAATIAASLGIPVHTIDAGGSGEDGAVLELGAAKERVARRMGGIKSLQEVAQLTGGKYFQASDTESLLATCRAIDQLERTEIQSFRYRRFFEGFPWFGLASFLALALVTALEMTIWQKVP